MGCLTVNDRLAFVILAAAQVGIATALAYSTVAIPEPVRMLLVVASAVLASLLNHLPAVTNTRHDPDL